MWSALPTMMTKSLPTSRAMPGKLAPNDKRAEGVRVNTFTKVLSELMTASAIIQSKILA